MKTKFTELECTYTGGGIYVVTAKYGDVYFVSDLELYGTYSIPTTKIEEEHDCKYDDYWKDSKYELPTWAELLEAILESYKQGRSQNMDPDEMEYILRRNHDNLNTRIGR